MSAGSRSPPRISSQRPPRGPRHRARAAPGGRRPRCSRRPRPAGHQAKRREGRVEREIRLGAPGERAHLFDRELRAQQIRREGDEAPHDRRDDRDDQERQTVEDDGRSLGALAVDRLGDQPGGVRHERDRHQQQQVGPQQRGADLPQPGEERVVREPDAADREETRAIGEIRRPRVEDPLQKIVARLGNVEIEHEQGDRNREHAVAEGLDPVRPPARHHDCRLPRSRPESSALARRTVLRLSAARVRPPMAGHLAARAKSERRACGRGRVRRRRVRLRAAARGRLRRGLGRRSRGPRARATPPGSSWSRCSTWRRSPRPGWRRCRASP